MNELDQKKDMKKASITLGADIKSFTVENHNKMIATIDSVIRDIKSFDSANLELQNAVKNLLEAAGRINNYYKSVNNPLGNGQQKTDEDNKEI